MTSEERRTHRERREKMTDPVLHLYALEWEHGDAYVVGNREGLRLLRDAIKDALQEGEGQTTYFGPFAEDGESYDLGVTLQPGGPHADGWARWRAPYFVAREKYRELGG
jgi:hypothetical protein